MKIWKHSKRDVIMLLLSFAQFGIMLLLAIRWETSSLPGRATGFALVVFMTVYNIIVVSHLFTHAHWFNSPLLNRLLSMLNSINIGQSVQAYELTHVRNHHRYNNDRPGPDGETKDASSTFRDGVNGEHAGPMHYAFFGVVATLLNIGRALFAVHRLWRVGEHEQDLMTLLAKSPAKRRWELRQVQLDRMAQFVAFCVFLALSWQWVVLCYIPAFFLALALVNIQNYYEHYGAAPENRYANSVSYYGRVYNLLTFNDGYHQEHHIRPLTHWTQMPRVRSEFRDKLNEVERIVSPVPALFGAFDRNRKQLHRQRPVIVQPEPKKLYKAAAGR